MALQRLHWLAGATALTVTVVGAVAFNDRGAMRLVTRQTATSTSPDITIRPLPVPEVGDPQHCPFIVNRRTEVRDRARGEFTAFLSRAAEQPDSAADLWVSFHEPKQQDELGLSDDLRLDGAIVVYPYTQGTVVKDYVTRLPIYPDLTVPAGLPTGHVSKPMVMVQADLIRSFSDDLERPHGPADLAILAEDLRRAEAGDLPLAAVRLKGTWRRIREYVRANQVDIHAVSTNPKRTPPFPEEPSASERAVEICAEDAARPPR